MDNKTLGVIPGKKRISEILSNFSEALQQKDYLPSAVGEIHPNFVFFLRSFDKHHVFSSIFWRNSIFWRKSCFSYDLLAKIVFYLLSFDENRVFRSIFWQKLRQNFDKKTASFGKNHVFSHDLLTKITFLQRIVNDNSVFSAILFFFFYITKLAIFSLPNSQFYGTRFT